MGHRLVFRTSGAFRGTLTPPPDKSLTHRAYMFAALAESGVSTIYNPLTGEDCESTLECLQKLGAKVEWVSPTEVRISAIEKWPDTPVELDCGNSGTTMRLLAGILAGRQGISATLTGDSSLSKRPMRRIADPLNLMGGKVEGETPPLQITGRELHAIDYESPIASAQVKSAVLLAGLHAHGTTSVTEPSRSRDHTERMLAALGVELGRLPNKAVVAGGQSWNNFQFRVPGDISSAAFFMVAAAIKPGSEVTLLNVGVNPTRTGILDVFDQVGVDWSLEELEPMLGEPVANITVRGTASLKPFFIAGELVPRLIDEIPVLCVLATQCAGGSIIRDATELRVKETDRIEVMYEVLRAMGGRIVPTADGMIVIGPDQLTGTSIDSVGDHRIGMSFAVAAGIAEWQTTILNAQAIQSSYPTFAEHYHQLCGQMPERVDE